MWYDECHVTCLTLSPPSANLKKSDYSYSSFPYSPLFTKFIKKGLSCLTSDRLVSPLYSDFLKLALGAFPKRCQIYLK